MTTNTNRVEVLAADAYSFRAYGRANWLSCIALLEARGYNAPEVSAILYSPLMRYATDTVRTGFKAKASHLADLLDNRMGGALTLRGYVDDFTVGIHAEDILTPPVVEAPKPSGLRLVWSRR